jgi:hypothetical protein
LRELLGYTSHGYIFHPVPFVDGRIGIVAIGSGYDGSGDPAVCSKRQEYGMDRLLPLHEALQVRTLDLDREGQIGYFVECILGASHGLSLNDLALGIEADSPVGIEVADRIAAALPRERALFMQAASLDEAAYRRVFGGPIAHQLLPLFHDRRRA